ncbi:mitochondrial import receptor subunit TOM40B-like isoform X4 [Narcine bancroftii]|uniref:mitochondrial import receptor subunit TOM40B-like isoform X4 n=1 Tax=Narcine bancroftii TaxID=1343680 RepID=UPI0038321B2F
MGNAAAAERRLRNPGSFERLHRRCKEVFPQQLEGVKLIINKHLSSHFQAAHIIHLSSMLPQYSFKAMYSGDQEADSGETQQERFQTWQFDTQYHGDSFTTTVTLGNPDILNQSVILVAHFLQSVTQNLVLGGEMVYHRRPSEEGAIFTLAAQYTASQWIGTLNIGRGGAHATYYHRANDQVQVGVGFEASTQTQETTFSFGYQLDIPKANALFRGSLDSNWVVGAALEKRLAPLPLTLALGAFIDHLKNKLQYGFTVTVC